MFYNFITKYTDIFVEKMNAKASQIFNQKYWHISDINIWNFNEKLTNDFVSFEQPGPEILTFLFMPLFSTWRDGMLLATQNQTSVNERWHITNKI